MGVPVASSSQMLLDVHWGLFGSDGTYFPPKTSLYVYNILKHCSQNYYLCDKIPDMIPNIPVKNLKRNDEKAELAKRNEVSKEAAGQDY